ncbi:RNA-dependent RNA polymerase 1 [Cladorrhinum samala]|uniref:RNA-dependent RNA polymerase n=1 Tax=Cladorrhinum samala TaxID=585594 RepID=A0AAV9HRT2_9PEZI|nr:RNA-dependent RNA polymerase 1 [Cladorrhinum samala]
MEISLRNLPPDLTEKALTSQLRPWMSKLNIAETDYVCDKLKKKFHGFVTFLHKADAQRFLAEYGEVPKPGGQDTHKADHNQMGKNKKPKNYPPSTPRLYLMGRAVFCGGSKRTLDKTALKAIEHQRTRTVANHQVQAAEPAEETAIVLETSRLACGYHAFVHGEFTFVSEWNLDVHCKVRFGKWGLVMTFNKDLRDYEVRVSYRSVVQVIWSDSARVAVTLSSSPTFLESKYNLVEKRALQALSSPKTNPDAMKRTSSIDHAHAAVSPFCLVYFFTASTADLSSQMLRLKQKELFHVDRDDLEHLAAHQTPLGAFSEGLADLKALLSSYTTSNALPFGLLFLLQALVHNGYLHPATVSAVARELAVLFEQARRDGADGPPITIATFKKLFQAIDYPFPLADPGQFEAAGVMEYLLDQERKAKERPALGPEIFGETSSSALILRAVVTPTRITFHGPEMEAKNRVLRKFPDHTDHFVRVQFCDEDGQDLYHNPRVDLEDVYERLKKVLDAGIPIAGRHYSFLGFSHSSLRARSVWLSAPFLFDGRLKVSANIIEELGDFQKIRSPARRAARIGQAFSETRWSVALRERGIDVAEIDDVEHDARTFSDGVGTISPGAVEAIYDVIASEKGYPTCFQIRWAGAKGMLTMDTRLAGNQICIRPSMNKFESLDKDNLEICDMAWKPAPLILNRQLIKILEDMGAPGSWFLELQERELKKLRGVTLTVFNTASFLQTQGVCQSVQLHKLLRQVDKMGYDYRTDSFLRSAIEAILLRELRLLKNKSRIPVPQGVTLFGVMDETGFLEEGEVYVAHESPDDLPRNGPLLVSRSPALHPGDIQRAENVIPPPEHPLRALKNCIVFSQKGTRDLPSQLSGGDLDGDLYHVLWDEAIVPEVKTYRPAEYPAVKPLELDRPVERADMSNFFVDFMKTDRLGVIASRHTILADNKAQGTLDPDCLKLAELHSNAVDFSKSGLPVAMGDLPKPPRWRPDFLAPGPNITIHNRVEADMDDDQPSEAGQDDGDEGPHFKYYKSDRIIGQLFRAVDEREIWHSAIRRNVPKGGGPTFWREFFDGLAERASALGNPKWRRRLREAETICETYNEAVCSIMVDCSDHPIKPLTELEVFVGFIINKSGVQSVRQRDKNIKLKDEFDRVSSWVIKEMRKQDPEADGELDALELCLACLHVGMDKKARDARQHDRGTSQGVVSFKIVAASALLRELNSVEKARRAAGIPAANDRGAPIDTTDYGNRPLLPTGREAARKPSCSAQGVPRTETHAAGEHLSGQQQQQHTLSVAAQLQLKSIYPQLFQ